MYVGLLQKSSDTNNQLGLTFVVTTVCKEQNCTFLSLQNNLNASLFGTKYDNVSGKLVSIVQKWIQN